jgi:hypothetical protein
MVLLTHRMTLEETLQSHVSPLLAHGLVVPYIDQNGIPQEPRFGISSLGGKTIREWSAKFYERVVEAKKRENEIDTHDKPQLKSQESAEEGGAISQATTRAANEDPIHILKILLTKGEIKGTI